MPSTARGAARTPAARDAVRSRNSRRELTGYFRPSLQLFLRSAQLGQSAPMSECSGVAEINEISQNSSFLPAALLTHILTEPANYQVMPIGSIQAKNVKNDFPLARINRLTNAQDRFARRHPTQLCGPLIGGRGVDFFVGVT